MLNEWKSAWMKGETPVGLIHLTHKYWLCDILQTLLQETDHPIKNFDFHSWF